MTLLSNGRPFIFPPRGTVASIGSESSLFSSSSSPAGKARAERLEYALYLEAQKRRAAERELRQVRIHGRSRPPWVGEGRSAGYGELYRERLAPQTR